MYRVTSKLFGTTKEKCSYSIKDRLSSLILVVASVPSNIKISIK